MGLGEEGVGLRSLDVLDAQTEIVGLVDGVRMDLLGLGPSDPPVTAIQILIVVVPPLVLRLQRISVPM